MINKIPAINWQLSTLDRLPPNKPGWWWDQVEHWRLPSDYLKINLEYWDDIFIGQFIEKLKLDANHPLWHSIIPMPFNNFESIVKIACGLRALDGQIDEVKKGLFSNENKEKKKAILNEIKIAGIFYDLGLTVEKRDLGSCGGPDFSISNGMDDDAVYVEVKSIGPVRKDFYNYYNISPVFIHQKDIHYNISLSPVVAVLLERIEKRRSDSPDHGEAIRNWIENKIDNAISIALEEMEKRKLDKITFESYGLAEFRLSRGSSTGSEMQFSGSPDVWGFWKLQRDGIDMAIRQLNGKPGILLIPLPTIATIYNGNSRDIIELVSAVFNTELDRHRNLMGVLFIDRFLSHEEEGWQYEYQFIENPNSVPAWKECIIYQPLINQKVYQRQYKNYSDYITALGECRFIS